MNTFEPLPIIIDFLQIAKINKEGIYHIKKLMNSLVYQAPEILESLFWHGTNNWYGITYIMNKYYPIVREENRYIFSPEQIEENKKMEKLYMDLLKKYQNKGSNK